MFVLVCIRTESTKSLDQALVVKRVGYDRLKLLRAALEDAGIDAPAIVGEVPFPEELVSHMEEGRFYIG